MPRLAQLLGTLALALLGACCCGPTRGATDSAGVREAVERLIAADNARDLQAVLALYTDDVLWLPPGEEPQRGKDTIGPRYERLFAEFAVAMEIEVVESRCEGTTGFAWGYVRGTLTPLSGGEPRRVDDKFLAVARFEPGGWRVAQLMWSRVEHGD